MSGLVQVNFHGQQIDCMRDNRGVFASLRRMCENMGIDEEGQRQRLSRRPWATTCMIKAVADDGKTRDMLMLGLDAVPMWLATIDSGRVSEAARPKIELYQKECAKVLYAHFFGTRRQRAIGAGPRKRQRMRTNTSVRLPVPAGNLLDRMQVLTGLSKSLIIEHGVNLFARHYPAILAKQLDEATRIAAEQQP